MTMTLGEKIKKYRQAGGLSQEQLSEKLSVSRQAVTKWESDKGIPDIHNLQAIAKLFNVSLDSLLAMDEKIGSIVLKEEIDIEKYKKTGKARSKYDMVVKEKYPKAMVIYPLIRRKKLNKMEAIIDFLTEPGVLEMVDSLNDMSAYYLVEQNGQQFLVNVTKTYIEGRRLKQKFEGKKCVIEKNIFIKLNYTL